MILTVSEQELRETYDAVRSDWKIHMYNHGVRMPNFENNNGLQLALLAHYRGILLDKDDIAAFVVKHRHGKADQQPRHLRALGWDVLLSGKSGHTLKEDMQDLNGKTYKKGTPVPSGMHALRSTTTPTPECSSKTRNTRASTTNGLTIEQWEAKKAEFHNACGMCGDQGCKLEKGHLNPFAPLTVDNVAPLCGSCNNWVSDDLQLVVHGGRVRIYAVLTERFVRDAPLDAKRRIFQYLMRDKNLRGDFKKLVGAGRKREDP